MASAAPNQMMPLFYNSLEPLNAVQHGKMKIRPVEKSPVMGRTAKSWKHTWKNRKSPMSPS